MGQGKAHWRGNAKATGPKTSGLELALVARSPPARTQYASDSRAGEIAPIRSVNPATTWRSERSTGTGCVLVTGPGH